MRLQLLNQTLIDTLVQKARNNQRLRQSYYFHQPEEKVQRTLLALEKGTYVRPHRHIRDNNLKGFEVLLVLRGCIGLMVFNEAGEIIDRKKMNTMGDNIGIEIEEGIYHSVVALESHTILFEIKEGGYDFKKDKDFLSQFPLEGTPEAQTMVTTWENYFD